MKKLLLLLVGLLLFNFVPCQAAIEKEQLTAVDQALRNAATNSKPLTINVIDYTTAFQIVTLLAKKGEINKGRFTCYNKPFLFTDAGAGSENSRIEYTPAGQKPTVIVWFQAQ